MSANDGIYYDADADLGRLQGKTIAILGYGSQGHAHALNLRDSGCEVVVGLRPGSASRADAESEGLTVLDVGEAASRGDVVMILLPDEKQAEAWEGEIRDGIARGQPADVRPRLLDPLRPDRAACRGRRRHGRPQGPRPPGPAPVHRGPRRSLPDGRAPGRDRQRRDLVLAYASGIGGGRAGVIETTFKDECETDLFGEQAVLCGGATELARAGFETLVEAGYDPRLAYFECLHELKLIVDLMYEKGIQGMRDSISNTAEYGDMTRGKEVITAQTREAMRKLLADIQSGEFAKEWIAENRAGAENFQRLREEAAGHQVEQVGRELRKMMPWIEAEPG